MFNRKSEDDLIQEQISDLFFNTNHEENRNSPSTTRGRLGNASSKKLFGAVLFFSCCFILLAVTVSKLTHHDKSTGKKHSSLPSVFDTLIDFDDPVSEYLGSSSIRNELFSGKAALTGELTLENLKSANNDVSGMALIFDLKHLAENNRCSLDFDVKYRSANALSASLYADDTALLLRVPTKSPKTFSVNYQKAAERLSTKPLSPYIKHYLTEASLKNLSGDWSLLYGGSDPVTLYFHYLKQSYPKDYEKILQGISFVPAEPDARGNNGFTYTMNEESLETLIKCLMTATFENEDLYRLAYPLMSYAVSHPFLSSEETEDTKAPTTAIDDIHYNLQASASAFALAHKGDFSFTVWKNKDGFITGIHCENDIKISEQVLKVKGELITEDDAHPFYNAKATLSLGYDSALLNVVFERNCKDDTVKEVNNHFYCDINGENSIEINRLTSIDTSDQSMEYQFSIVTPNEADNFLIACYGKVSIGKILDFIIDKLYINDGFSNLMTLNGKLSVQTENVIIDKPTGNRYELTDLSDEELKKLFGK